jgi:hypothetical protein
MMESKQQPAAVAAPEAEPRFDVLLSIGLGMTPEAIRQKVQASQVMPPEKVEAMLKAVAARSPLKVGQEVPRSRAEKAKRDLESVGFKIELKPVLSLEAMDLRIVCPHCNNKVEVGDSRLCPSCGENVDQFDPKKKLRERIEAEERERIEAMLAREKAATERRNAKAFEDALRARIRAELEKQYGLNQPWRRRLLKVRTGFMVSGLLTVVLASGMTGGLLLQTFGRHETVAAAPARLGAELDAALQILDSRHERLGAFGASAVAGAAPSGTASLANLALKARAEGQGQPVDQALARAPWGHSASAPAGATPALALADRRQLTQNFALGLAEMGQPARAREVLAQMAATQGGGASASAEVLVEAWALGQPGADVTGAQVQTLRTKALAISDPAEQVRALSGTAAALAASGQLPMGLSEALMETAAQTANGLSDPAQRAQAIGAWYMAAGDLQHARTLSQARNGDLPTALTKAEQLGELRRQAPAGLSAAYLGGLHYHALHKLGQTASAPQVMAETIARMRELPSVAAQAEFLRQLGQACGDAVPTELLSAAATLHQKIAAAQPSERSLAYLSLARLAVLAGQPENAKQWLQDAEQKLPSDGSERARLQASWLVGEQLDLARRAQLAGQMGEREQHVSKLAAYLM